MIGQKIGKIKFDKMIAYVRNDEGFIENVRIKRTDGNQKYRPQPNNRFHANVQTSINDNKLDLFNMKDLEWLAWNWRAMINEKKYASRKKMVYENFNRSVPMMPSLKQIL